MSPRNFVIGDVHGCIDEMRALWEVMSPTRDDVIVSAGDLVDKGPDSPGVVKFFREKQEAGFNVVLVRGNHDEKHERVRARIARGDDPSGIKGSMAIKAITDALSPEDVAFLDRAVLYHAIPEHGSIVVHAGIPPAYERFPTEAERASVSRVKRDQFDQVLRVRHVNMKTGLPIPMGEESPSDPFWATVYTGKFGHVYFGHEPFTKAAEPVRFPHATALDLGCVFGGRMAAAVLEVGCDVRFVSVAAHTKYSTHFSE